MPARDASAPSDGDSGAATATSENATPQSDPVTSARRWLTSVSPGTRVYSWTARDSLDLGQVRVGSSVAVRDRAPVPRPDCPRGYYAIEPHGYVCLDATALLTGPDHPVPAEADRFLRALETTQPAFGPLPFGYAVSLGAPLYGRVPRPAEQETRELTLGPIPTALDRLPHRHADLADPVVLRSDRETPWFLAGGEASPVYIRGKDDRLVRKVAPPGCTVSYAAEFEADGRSWLLTPDLRAVPAERVRVLRPSSFHGVALGQGLDLPVAWTKSAGAVRFRRSDSGALWEDGALPRRTAIALTGEQVVHEGTVYLATREPNTYVRQSAVSVVRQAKRPRAASPDDRWILVSLRACTLTAYEGDRAVFTTLVSPGQGGVLPTASMHDVILAEATPVGVFRVQYKDRFQTLSPDPAQKKNFVSDVPYVQYFSGPFALHTAYWHDDFGAPRSAGCVNLAPLDGQWLFGWTGPPVPEGWQGAWARQPNGRGTVVQLVP